MKYNHQKIEKKWQEFWEKNKTYQTKENKDKEKFYILDMFPYPSGVGLHVGHPKGYIATDIVARMKMIQGYNVLHPMGWDAFGLPAENFAIKNKVHPREMNEKNIATFKSQLGKLGFTYDWNREINTTDPEFYKWTQWTFIQMFKKGLAYESHEPINWCPSCKTGLANEDLENGKCERCDSEIEQKPMRQWVLKITDYADRMLNDLEKLPEWDNSIKEMQKNWIGRSEGVRLKFEIRNLKFKMNDEISNDKITEVEVFTTRPDTLFGVTYMVLAPEHELIKSAMSEAREEVVPRGGANSDGRPVRTDIHPGGGGTSRNAEWIVIENLKQVEEYVEKAKNKTEIERTAEGKGKSGIELKGIKAINPVNNEELPIYIADYVLADYGTGAIMAVPAHDERDFEFAKKYDIDIKQVVESANNEQRTIKGNMENMVYTSKGNLINSGKFDGMDSEEAKKAITEFVGGEMTTSYKLRDWVFSRQRYWGEPIPIIHCEKCGAVPVPEKDLPVILPEVESYEPSGTGESPLVNITDWVNTTCPKCGGAGKRETNTMPQWAGSSWYYLRYIDPHNSEALVDKKKEKYWSPVDFYVGGAEHATRHLIYARFWHKFLYDIGAVSYEEPFTKLKHVGLIMAEDGRKMSKRWGNVINPDDIVEEFGADAMRIYEMFMGPFSQSCAWNTKGLIGARRFLEKVWRLAEEKDLIDCGAGRCGEVPKEIPPVLHKTIKKVTEDIESMDFNTAIAQMMIFVNEATRHKVLPKGAFKKFLIILSPFAPHIAEELWAQVGEKDSIFSQTWPEYNPEMVQDNLIEMPIQVNGKVRDKIKVSVNISEGEAKEKALASEKVQKHIDGKEIKKVIFVKGRLISVVV